MGCGASSSSGAGGGGATLLQLGSSFTTKRRGGEAKKGQRSATTVWVGHIPTTHANKPALEQALGCFGAIVALNVRYKPDQAAGGNQQDRSWAFVTFEAEAAAREAVVARVAVRCGVEQRVLTVQPADVTGERQRIQDAESEEERSARLAESAARQKRERLFSPSMKAEADASALQQMGARERVWVEQQQAARQAAEQQQRRSEQVAADLAAQAAAAERAARPQKWTCAKCQKRVAASRDVCDACGRGFRDEQAARGALRQRRERERAAEAARRAAADWTCALCARRNKARASRCAEFSLPRPTRRYFVSNHWLCLGARGARRAPSRDRKSVV